MVVVSPGLRILVFFPIDFPEGRKEGGETQRAEQRERDGSVASRTRRTGAEPAARYVPRTGPWTRNGGHDPAGKDLCEGQRGLGGSGRTWAQGTGVLHRLTLPGAVLAAVGS